MSGTSCRCSVSVPKSRLELKRLDRALSITFSVKENDDAGGICCGWRAGGTIAWDQTSKRTTHGCAMGEDHSGSFFLTGCRLANRFRPRYRQHALVAILSITLACGFGALGQSGQLRQFWHGHDQDNVSFRNEYEFLTGFPVLLVAHGLGDGYLVFP